MISLIAIRKQKVNPRSETIKASFIQYYCIAITIKTKSTMQGQARAIDTLSVRRPQPHNANQQKESEGGKAV